MMKDTWRYIEDGLGEGRWNMAVDQALLRACESGDVAVDQALLPSRESGDVAVDQALLRACESGDMPPTLRLYGWQSPVLTVGYSQNLEREVDLDACRGIPCVRRPTGGRALLHHRELTYSIVAPVSHPYFSGGLKQTFSAISEALLLGLRELGIDQACINNQKKIRSQRSPACFASLNHCEITVQDRKLIGSAQRRTQGAFLQHGSIPIEASTVDVHSFLRYDSAEARRDDTEKTQRFTTTLNAVCGEPVSFEQTRSALRTGFEKCFPGNWTAGGLTPAEKNYRDRILESADSVSPAIF